MIPSDNIFDAFNQLNVLVVGDVMIDRYLNGKVERISPEAPVPVVHLETSENRLGGAANVALNLKALGATPYLCSMIGNDRDGEIFKNLLPENGLSNQCILQSSERPTTVKTRILSGSQQLLREALKRDIPTTVDPKFNNFWEYKNVTLFKPNLKEIRSQLSTPVHPELDSLKNTAAHIYQQLGNHYTLITLSENGLFIDHQGESLLLGTAPRQIADVSGAGDTVISVASLGLALKMNIEDIAVLSNISGGQVCEKLGVMPVDKAELQLEYEKYKKLS